MNPKVRPRWYARSAGPRGGGKCLDKIVDLSHWIDEPHAERVEAAARVTDESTEEDTSRDL